VYYTSNFGGDVNLRLYRTKKNEYKLNCI